MKNEYKKPVVKMIDYAYQEQVVASSSDTAPMVNGHEVNVCTFTWPNCEWLYSTGYSCEMDIPSVPSI